MKKILNLPFFYNLYQQSIGCNRYLKKLTYEYIRPNTNSQILEIGCGTGNIIKYIQNSYPNLNIDYTGIDISQKYIKYNIKKYPKHKFICINNDSIINLNKKFDIILLEAVISGIDNKNINSIFSIIKNHSSQNTRIIISDTNYKTDAGFIKKFLYNNERNHFMRTKEQIIDLVSPHFKINNISEIKNPYIIPYEKLVFELSL